MFAKPKEDASRAVHNLDLAEGSITAEVYLSRQSSRPAASIYQGTSGEATVAKMPEGKVCAGDHAISGCTARRRAGLH